MNPTQLNDSFYQDIRTLILQARNQALQSINQTMMQSYFLVGKRIVEEEQGGKARAEYAKNTLKLLSEKLNQEFGKGYSVDNLQNMRRFFLKYQKYETLSRKSPLIFNLSWSHYLFLSGIDNEAERKFYEIEAQQEKWSLRELRRQFDAALFERLAMSKDKAGIKELYEKGQIFEKAQDLVKDPYILEFLGLDEKTHYSESDLEQAIINKIERFLLELGKGFLFVGRQKRISFEEKHFYIDLVFYHRILRCFVLIDLKIGDLSHQDLGQMQMYVHYYDREIRLADENLTVGIVICKRKTDSVVEYTLPEKQSANLRKQISIVPTQQRRFAKTIERNQ